MKALKTFLALALLLGSGVAIAGGAAYNVTVIAVQASVAGTGIFVVYLSAALSGQPSCANGAGASTLLIIDPNTAPGRAALAAASIAYSLGKTVDVWGSGTCTLTSNNENLLAIQTTD
jgi:hypothetical protein